MRGDPMKIKQFLTGLTIITTLSLGGIALVAQPVMAGSPIVYNQHGSYVPLVNGTKSRLSIRAWLKNSTHFYMHCYVVDGWYNGNYSTNKWFWGQSDYQGWGWVHASYVYYQTSVPRC